ncbi:hypothetical protein chiPu_0014643 [Chiloscyllium punctatum]|uniref:GED domain-containing protein n=1 Tax=Chiloscyllium punctatum TaxID=137246 RepID=A0A401T0K3_CHIPU|nr:hypothetical protein [Chiloscyllium punctatum]
MKAEIVKHDYAYLADIFNKCNLLIMQLQGDNVSFIKARNAVTSFIAKLDLFHRNISRREFYQFLSLNNIAEDVIDDQLLIYSAHVRVLQHDMKIRFADLTEVEIPTWLTDPFISCAEGMDIRLQVEMIGLQNDTAMKIRFSQMGEPLVWIQDATRCCFPLLSEEAKRFARPFPTSYLVEKGFRIVTRCPLELKLKKVRKENVWKGKIKYKDYVQILKSTTEVEQEINKTQNTIVGRRVGISPELISLEIESTNVPDLTLTDLPGIARVAVGNQPVNIGDQTFESLVRDNIVELEEPAINKLKVATELTRTASIEITEEHFKAFSNLFKFAKIKIESISHQQESEAEKMLKAQFKIENMVYSQDKIYSSNLSTTKNTPSIFGANATVQEMSHHVQTYYKIASYRLADQIPLVICYHILREFANKLQGEMLTLLQDRDRIDEYLFEDQDTKRKRETLQSQMSRPIKAHKALLEFA